MGKNHENYLIQSNSNNLIFYANVLLFLFDFCGTNKIF